MPTRRSVEQDLASGQQTISQLEKQIREIKEYITSSEKTWQNASEPLRSITQDGLTKARANLAQQEMELQQARNEQVRNQKILSVLESVDTLQQYIDKYSELLEKARSDLSIKEQELLDLTSPVTIPQFELVMAGGSRVAIPTDRAALTIGCRDQANNILPDIDLTPFGGQSSGASRRHAKLQFAAGQWTITDLDSSNGTFVNEVRLTANVPTPLPANAQIRFGRIVLSFQSAAAANRTVRLS